MAKKDLLTETFDKHLNLMREKLNLVEDNINEVSANWIAKFIKGSPIAANLGAQKLNKLNKALESKSPTINITTPDAIKYSNNNMNLFYTYNISLLPFHINQRDFDPGRDHGYISLPIKFQGVKAAEVPGTQKWYEDNYERAKNKEGEDSNLAKSHLTALNNFKETRDEMNNKKLEDTNIGSGKFGEIPKFLLIDVDKKKAMFGDDRAQPVRGYEVIAMLPKDQVALVSFLQTSAKYYQSQLSKENYNKLPHDLKNLYISINSKLEKVLDVNKNIIPVAERYYNQ